MSVDVSMTHYWVDYMIGIKWQLLLYHNLISY